MGTATWLWLSAGLFLLLLSPILVLSIPQQQKEPRGLDDFNVFSHVFMLLPLALAIHVQLNLVAVTLALSLSASFLYHIYYDMDTVHGWIDMGFSLALALVLILLAADSFVRGGDRNWLGIAAGLGLVAAGLLYIPKATSLNECTKEKLHVMWHLNAFAASTIVIYAASTGSGGGLRALEWLYI